MRALCQIMTTVVRLAAVLILEVLVMAPALGGRWKRHLLIKRGE